MLTLLLEQILSKERILEIYLNNVEWGEGVFGAGPLLRSTTSRKAQPSSPHRRRPPGRDAARAKRFEKTPGSAYLAGARGRFWGAWAAQNCLMQPQPSRVAQGRRPQVQGMFTSWNSTRRRRGSNSPPSGSTCMRMSAALAMGPGRPRSARGGRQNLHVVVAQHLPLAVCAHQQGGFLINAHANELGVVEHRADEPVVAGAVHEMLVHDGALEEAKARASSFMPRAMLTCSSSSELRGVRHLPVSINLHHRSTGRGAAHHRACLVARLNGLACARAHQQAGQARLVSPENQKPLNFSSVCATAALLTSVGRISTTWARAPRASRSRTTFLRFFV